MTGASIVTFLFTSYRTFSFLGQAERYFEYSAPFISLLISFTLLQLPAGTFWLGSLLLLHGVILIWLHSLGSVRASWDEISKTGSGKGDPLYEYLNTQQDPLRLLTIPVKSSWEIDFYIDNPQINFYFLFICDQKTGFDYLQEDLIKYPFPKPDLDYFQEKYGINAIIASPSTIESLKKQGIDYHLEKYPEVVKNDRYVLYLLTQHNSAELSL
jgi:hypothetical protein